MIDISKLKSPCHKCNSLFLDKNKEPCNSCKERIIYDALLNGVSKNEFDSWYLPLKAPLKKYRCNTKGCFRRVQKKGEKCVRCQRVNGKPIKRKLENKQDIIYLEKVMMAFVCYCEKRFDNLSIAAKEFGVNPTYIYTIKNFEVYPSKSMAFAMQLFMESE
jgi:hypothetical protein